jgi:hypothetical protein
MSQRCRRRKKCKKAKQEVEHHKRIIVVVHESPLSPCSACQKVCNAAETSRKVSIEESIAQAIRNKEGSGVVEISPPYSAAAYECARCRVRNSCDKKKEPICEAGNVFTLNREQFKK